MPGEKSARKCPDLLCLGIIVYSHMGAKSEQNMTEGTGVHPPVSICFHQTSSVPYRCLLARSAFPMRETSGSAEDEGCIDPTYQLNQMLKYLCRNDHCHLIC